MAAAVKKSKTQEMRVRRMAERQGVTLVKSRRRDELAKDYGVYWLVSYDLADEPGPWGQHGRPIRKFPFAGMELDEVEQFLKTKPADR